MGECRQQKHTQHAPSTKTECDYLNGWIKKRSHTQKSHPKVVNPRDIAGERKKKKKKKKIQQMVWEIGLGWERRHIQSWKSVCVSRDVLTRAVCTGGNEVTVTLFGQMWRDWDFTKGFSARDCRRSGINQISDFTCTPLPPPQWCCS